MFIETLQFTIPIDLCTVFSSLQKGPKSNLEFPASVNSYGTTQDANIQVALHANKLTFTVDGVSSNASMISKSECKTLRLSVFDVDRSLIPQESEVENYEQMPSSASVSSKRLHDNSSSIQPAAKVRHLESTPIRSPARRIPQAQSSSPSNNTHSKSQNDSSVSVKQEPEDPDLIEIEPDPEPDDIVPKTETPYMQIDYSSDVPHTQTSQAALDRLSHPQSSHSQSPGSSSSSFHQNVPHVPDYSEPSTSQVHHGDQSADDYLVFQDDNDYGDDNEADYSNDGSIVRLLHPPSQELPHDMGGLSGDSFQFSNLSSSNQCSLCGKTFSSHNSCKRHIETSHRNLKFSCECGKSYTRQTDLHRHQLAAHGNEACVCVCGKTYVYVRGLRAHQKNCSVYKSTV
ncbi:zinc finger and BTB domain-containing protein 17-like isoform X2 [Haliotis asinina]|uniref:zinc finger and BTB domain-containing protein 17-like isoform X2 n=1 Tax=Haliotis asinina TaxID=109174 RepID=UPI003531E2F0